MNINLGSLLGSLIRLPGFQSPGLPGFPLIPGPPTNGNTSGQSGVLSGRLPLALLLGDEPLRLNPQELSGFLKDTMSLPKEMRLLLLQLALEASPEKVKKQINQTLKDAIEDNMSQLSVSVEDLQALLKEKSEGSIQKLLKLLQTNHSSEMKGGQNIIETLGTMTKLTEKIKASPQEATETLMLLYIPWYPLAPKQDLLMDFETGGGEDGSDSVPDCSVVLYLETATLGRFKILVEELNPLQIVVTVSHEAAGEHILSKLETRLNDWLAHEGLPAAVFEREALKAPPPLSTSDSPEASPLESPPVTAGFKGATRQDDHKKLMAQKGAKVSVLLLNTAYTIARFIFEFDEHGRSLQKSS